MSLSLIMLISYSQYTIIRIRSVENHSYLIFNRKISLLTSKLNIGLSKNLVRCYVWSIALYGSETWVLRNLERKYLKSIEIWFWRRMEKIKWPEKVTNEVLQHVGEKRTLLHNILFRKAYLFRIEFCSEAYFFRFEVL